MAAVRDSAGKSAKPRFSRGQKVRITAGAAKDTIGVVLAEYEPLKPRSWRTWVLKCEDIDRREIRDEYLEPVP